MFHEKKGSVLIKAALGSLASKPVNLVCDKITNARIVKVYPTTDYQTRYGQNCQSQTIVAEDLDIPGFNHRITAFKENIDRFAPQFVEGAIIEATGLTMAGRRGSTPGLNLLDLKTVQAPPVPAVVAAPAAAPVAEAPAE
jgi:hypothetical protein